ncbi:cytochrome P450 306a1 isoform X2 [Cephus cinctus]|uniref:Cytochrome P450 306a1 isoform X2 n=1 Tax=Cephus cinctus TaxID=211228 RepID=A0AAJ7RR86_CEPCN|nr:cytochrome P450 306a1 isoform X2 [Cephus cinctus]
MCVGVGNCLTVISDCDGLICAEGKLWREQRRFAVSCLKNLGMLKFGGKRDRLEARIIGAVDESVSKLSVHSGRQGVDPFETLHHCLGNLMNRIVFGKDYREDDVVWKWLRHLQEEGVKHIGVAGPLNFLPILRLLPRFSKVFDYLIDGKRKTHQVYKQIIAEHRNQVDNGEETMDSVLAAFDDEMRRRMNSDDPGHFTEPQFLHFLADLFGASTDTTLATIRWFLLFMVAYPEEQLRIQQELDAVLRGKNVSLDDRSALPYLEAAIAETQRIRSVVPVGIPHGTTEDTLIAGYEVPKGSMVVPLQWAIHMNPKYWQDPTKFKPERFIAQDGSLAKPEAFLPFQTGKRMCLGEDLAKMMLFLFTGRILQRLNLTSPEDQQLDLTGECGITMTPKPYRLIFTSRS